MPRPLRILIVEDQFITLHRLRSALQKLGHHLSGDAMNREEAVAVLDRGQTDLAILDINLRGRPHGLELGRLLHTHYRIPFIYLSAYSDLRSVDAAAQTHPAAFLVKPFLPDDLRYAITLAVGAVHGTAPAPAHTRSLFLRKEDAYYRVDPEEILYVQDLRDYLEVSLADRRHVVHQSLQSISSILPEARFLRAHEAFLVNLDRVTAFNGHYLQVGTARIPVGRGQRAALSAALAD